MNVIKGRIVAEMYYTRKVGIESRSHCLLRETCKSVVISVIDAGRNDDNNLRVRGCLNEVALVKG